MISTHDFNHCLVQLRRFFAPPPSEEPDEWAERVVNFNEEQIKGRCDFTGRNYLRRPIRDNNNPKVREQTLVFGRGCGKTISQIIGILFKIVFAPVRGLMVFPSTNGEGGSRNFVSTRLIPDLEATAPVVTLLPRGQIRFAINNQHARIGGAHFGFVGSNSAGQVVGNRLGDIRMDEKEKFRMRLGNEAGTANLIKGSTEGVAEYQIFNTSTPSIENGLIWQDVMRSNLHLRFMPCPHCNGGLHGKTEEERVIEAKSKNFAGWLILAWSEQFAAGLPRKFIGADTALNGREIPTAFLQFRFAENSTKENPVNDAKGRDGAWNVQRAKQNAHFICPHCRKAIRDVAADNMAAGRMLATLKLWMDTNGCWICVKPSEPGHVGYLISSLYAPVINEESTWGGRAVAFLNAVEEGGEAIRNFINSILGLPEMGQEHAASAEVEILNQQPRADSVLRLKMLSGDRQEKYPGFWYVVWEFVFSILRPARTAEQQIAFLKELPAEEKELVEKICGSLLPPAPATLYSPFSILEQIQRTDHWPRLADWLIANGLTGKRLVEFFQVEFQTDLIRLLEFIARQPEVNVPLGKQGDSQGLEIGSADSWEELDEVQRRHNISNPDVMVDARFGSMDNAEVYAECFRRCPPAGFIYYSPIQTPLGMSNKFSQGPIPGLKPFALGGWTPCMGFPEHKAWPSKDKIRLPYGQVINDPFSGKMEARQYFQYVFQFDAQWALSEMARVRKRYAFGLSPEVKFFGLNAEMRPVDRKEFDHHMKGYFWDDRNSCWDSPAKHGGSQSRLHPNHLYDCIKNMIALAVWKGVFRYEKDAKNSEKTL
jgi:uncharacterized protein with PIN domain